MVMLFKKGVGLNFKTPTPFAEYIPWFKNCIANDLRSLPLKHLTKKGVELIHTFV